MSNPTSNRQLRDALTELVKRCPFVPTATGVMAEISFAQIKQAQEALRSTDETSGDATIALRRYIFEQLGFLNDDDNCPAERYVRLAVERIRSFETKAEPACTCGATWKAADCPKHGDPAALTAAARPVFPALGAASIPFRHWSKDPMIPYTGCTCSSCEEMRKYRGAEKTSGEAPPTALKDVTR